uniref:Exportin-5 C-terminal domain-containing protein n=1 Tax=Odontella aurita TaxID=265563 RepID=A0A7S4J8L4_9STRA
MSSSLIQNRIQSLISSHGNGEPRDHLDPQTNQLTPLSDANIQFEGIFLPLENILQGVPQWSVDLDRNPTDQKRVEIRSTVRASLSVVASMIVSWSPADTYLRIRRSDLLSSLKHYWKYDPSTLASGVDALLGYLSAEDDRKTASGPDDSRQLSDETVALRKRSGVGLISVAKRVPHLLVPWLGQLSERARTLLDSESLLPPNRMHIFELLSCVATAVEDPIARANFIADVLSNSLEVLNSSEVMEATNSVEGLMSALGISQASNNPTSVTDPTTVKYTISTYVKVFSAFNQLLSVGKRCHEAAKKRPNGGLPLQSLTPISTSISNQPGQQNFPDEGPVRIEDLAINDPFTPLWPRFLPALIRTVDAILKLWHPEFQAILLQNSIQRYVYAISDDEAYLATKQDSSGGGVFGKGGTAGSVVSGWNRRDTNLAPKWSGWFNELRNTCFQLLGLLSSQRALYAPELASIFPEFVAVVANPAHLRSLEHRHFTQYLKQFIEILVLTCPATLYRSHLSPILEPVFENLMLRLQKSWAPILDVNVSSGLTTALTTPRCGDAAALALTGGDKWFEVYYARGGLFVGDLDAVTAEAAVEKVRVELCRTYSDVLQAVLALKGDWALVLANQAKEEHALRRHDPSKLTTGPKSRLGNDDGCRVNADGTPRGDNVVAIEARKSLRIHGLCQFILLEDERIAYSMVTGVVECLRYPDAYTCRRCARISHRILETVAWDGRYTDLLGNRLFSIAVEAIVTEPKWMVGIEWDMMNLIRDIYCRLVLGQILLPGGQGPAVQQPRNPSNPNLFEQSKNADNPLQGGGVLCQPSTLPQQLLARLPGSGITAIQKLSAEMTEKRAAKDQKDVLRDLLRVIADNLKQDETDVNRVFVRAVEEESLLNQKAKTGTVPDLPEKLVTQSMIARKQTKLGEEEAGQAARDLFS